MVAVTGMFCVHVSCIFYSRHRGATYHATRQTLRRVDARHLRRCGRGGRRRRAAVGRRAGDGATLPPSALRRPTASEETSGGDATERAVRWLRRLQGSAQQRPALQPSHPAGNNGLQMMILYVGADTCNLYCLFLTKSKLK